MTNMISNADEIQKALKQMHKKYSEVAQIVKPVSYLDTGVRLWNYVIAGGMGGGFPMGHFTMLYGPKGSYKSTLLQQVVRYVQSGAGDPNGQPGAVLWLDAENAFDMTWAQAIGVNIDPESMLWDYAKSNILDEAFIYLDNALQIKIDTGWPLKLVVVDSFANMTTSAQWDKEYGHAGVAPESRFYSQNLPKLLNKFEEAEVALVGITQVRTEIGKMWGNPEKAAGGNSLHHNARIVTYAKGQKSIKKKSEGPADYVNVTMNNSTEHCKNQLGGAMLNTEVEILVSADMYSGYVGADDVTDLVRYCALTGVFTNGRKEQPNNTNQWFYHKGMEDAVMLGKGESGAVEYLIAHPDFYDKISNEVQQIDITIREMRSQGARAESLKAAWQTLVNTSDVIEESPEEISE